LTLFCRFLEKILRVDETLAKTMGEKIEQSEKKQVFLYTESITFVYF